MTVQSAFILGLALGICVSPALVVLVLITLKRTRQREDPWL